VAPSPRRSVLAVACLALVGVVVATLPTASDVVASDQAKVSKQLKETGEALDNANRKVKKAMSAWNRANDRLPGAREKLRTARQSEAEAKQTQRIAELKLQSAESALQVNLNRQGATKRRITEIQSKMDSVARGLYQQGPFAEMEVVLSAADPGDFTLRLAALNSIGQSQARIGNELATVQADLVMQGVEREALKLAAERDAMEATQAAERAEQARVAAAQAEQQIRSLVSARRAAAQRAKQHRGAVQARYQRLKVEQARIQRAAAAAARREAARLAALKRQSQSSEDVPSSSGALRWPVDGGRISGHVTET